MDKDKRLLLKNYLSSLQVSTNVADFTHCDPNWRDLDYTPEYNKFYFIVDGEGWLKIGQKEYYPKAGELFLMPAGIIQSYSTISKNTFKKYWCHFNATVGDMNLFDIVQLPYYIKVSDHTILESHFKQVIENYMSNDLTASLKVKSALLEIVAYYLENTVIEKINITASESSEKLGYILNYIDSHINEDITVEELAGLAYFHPNYFIKFFKKHLGSSPVQYINKVRIERAKKLLRTTDMTIGEVAEAAGFNNIHYFSKIIKNYTGFSPSEFRSISGIEK